LDVFTAVIIVLPTTWFYIVFCHSKKKSKNENFEMEMLQNNQQFYFFFEIVGSKEVTNIITNTTNKHI